MLSGVLVRQQRQAAEPPANYIRSLSLFDDLWVDWVPGWLPVVGRNGRQDAEDRIDDEDTSLKQSPEERDGEERDDTGDDVAGKHEDLPVQRGFSMVAEELAALAVDQPENQRDDDSGEEATNVYGDSDALFLAGRRGLLRLAPGLVGIVLRL